MNVTMDSLLPLMLVVLPSAFGALIFMLPEGLRHPRRALLALGAAATFALADFVAGQSLEYTRPWALWGMDFSLKLTASGGALVIAASALAFLLAIYALIRRADAGRLFDGCVLMALAMANGAIMANNLIAMLFFWQAMWAPMFVMIQSGGEGAWRVSVRAVFTAALTDLCMILGMALAGHAAETMTMDAMHVPMNAPGTAGFLLMAVGAAAKLGVIPFHGWIGRASGVAPAPFMALVPGALNLLMGANLLSKFPGMFEMGRDAWPLLLVLVLGAGTVLLSGMLSLTAGSYKKLAIALNLAQGGALVLGVTSSAGGVFTYAAIAAAAAGFVLFLAAGALDGAPGRKAPLAVGAYYAAALAAVAVAFSGAVYRIALQDGILGLMLSLVSLVGAIFAGIGALGFARHTALFEASRVKDEPVTEMDGALAWLETTFCDPYPVARRAFRFYARISLVINDAISWFYDVAVVWFVGALSGLVKRAHNGSQSRYVIWVLWGVVIVIAIFALS
jgi:NADH-quinone oxidoreductase subunit L